MTTNTVETRTHFSSPPTEDRLPIKQWRIWLRPVAAVFVVLGGVGLFANMAHASAVPGPWTAIFKGIDLALGTNNPNIGGNFPRWQTVRCVRVDLTDPDVSVFSTPLASGSVAESRETLTLTVPNFLSENQLQIACDANFYSANPGGSDPTSEGLSCDVFGLQISDGTVVSAQTYSDASGDARYASILFSTNKQPQMIFVNRPPGTNTAGIFTAITGYYPIVSNGVNIGAAASIGYNDPSIHQVQPRTAYGLSQDNRYLYLMTIDGRQPGYSDGALDQETAYWLIQFGAWNGINMDGGGSTALYTSDSAGNPVGLNHSSYLAAYGHERYIGSHFGVRAKPLPGYINDVSVLPDDTAATVTWTTTNVSTSLVQYGLTTSLGSSSTYSSAMVTNHAALLTGLIPGTGYYYRVFSSDGSGQYGAGLFFFTTSNYATTNLVFDVTNSWTYSTANLDGINWTAPGYDDSGWNGSSPGLLWTDSRGPNPNISSLNTQMPLNPGTGFPYITYYFRTHFNMINTSPGATFVFTSYIDDGAIFYLNGVEIHRVNMALAPTQILNSTLASAYSCNGDATCPDIFIVSGDAMTNLVAGDNVLAAEVHNYNAQSPDITFGTALGYTSPYAVPPQLNIQQSSSALTVSWSRGGFTLQQAASPIGPWVNVPGPIVTSPYNTPNSGAPQYFRLIK